MLRPAAPRTAPLPAMRWPARLPSGWPPTQRACTGRCRSRSARPSGLLLWQSSRTRSARQEAPLHLLHVASQLAKIQMICQSARSVKKGCSHDLVVDTHQERCQATHDGGVSKWPRRRCNSHQPMVLITGSAGRACAGGGVEGANEGPAEAWGCQEGLAGQYHRQGHARAAGRDLPPCP